MPIEYVGKTTAASRLLRYTVTPKPGQTIKDRVLHVAGQHCRPETAEREFAATRRRHGTQGATRQSPSRYKLPEPGEIATHLRRRRPNGRGYWDEARSGETATHVHYPGIRTRQAEALHWITSFSSGEVNPNDTEQVSRAFQYVLARHRDLYPGEQATFVGQADGTGNMFHVHITRNATLYADMIVGGRNYSAGRKLAGALTNIDAMRERADRFLSEHGADYGLGPQVLPSVPESKRETRNQRDRRMAARGERSNHDVIRDAFEAAMDDTRAIDLESWIDLMAMRDVVVTTRPQRASSGKAKSVTYQLPGMPVPVRGSTLGTHYDFVNVVRSLDAKSIGRPRQSRPDRFTPPPPKTVSKPSLDQLETARLRMEELAAAESALRSEEATLDAWITERARAEKVAFGDILERLPKSHTGQVRVMSLWQAFASDAEAERESSDDPSAVSKASDARPSEGYGELSTINSTRNASDAVLLDKLILRAPATLLGRPTPDLARMISYGANAETIVAIREVWDQMTEKAQRDWYDAKFSPSTQPRRDADAASAVVPPLRPARESRGASASSPAPEPAVATDLPESPAPVSAGAILSEDEPSVDHADEPTAANPPEISTEAQASDPVVAPAEAAKRSSSIRREALNRRRRRFPELGESTDAQATDADRDLEI
ncbi:hypothetical protein [Microbacterium forte]